MEELLRKLRKLTPAKKAGVTAGVVLLAALVDYQFFYSDASARIASARAHETDLQDEMSGYARRRGEYLGFRAELEDLQKEQRELLRVLPKRAEIPSFLASVQEQAELVGLEVLSVDIGQEAPQDQYLRIPVKMEVRGTYHQVARFFRNVSELQRIVDVENLSLAPDKDKVVGIDLQGGTPPKLRAKFVAATFRFNDKTATAGTP
ncbi:MAG TPA: type 4a pilus biogenesis protein PilO [Polyangia bacterium]|jgi:type IV pilus assembly protein PilO